MFFITLFFLEFKTYYKDSPLFRNATNVVCLCLCLCVCLSILLFLSLPLSLSPSLLMIYYLSIHISLYLNLSKKIIKKRMMFIIRVNADKIIYKKPFCPQYFQSASRVSRPPPPLSLKMLFISDLTASCPSVYLFVTSNLKDNLRFTRGIQRTRALSSLIVSGPKPFQFVHWLIISLFPHKLFIGCSVPYNLSIS